MKNIIYIIAMVFITHTAGYGQMTGKRFIQGNASIDFSNRKYKGSNDDIMNHYGYGIDVSFGKFKKENFATGWLLGSTLSGGKGIYSNEFQSMEKSGLTGLQFSVGKFWHFYKTLGEKIGIYGGPDVRLQYTYSNKYEIDQNSPNQALVQTKSNGGSLSIGLKGSIYYTLSERWWLEASLAYANPVYIEFTKGKTGTNGDLSTSTSNLAYQLTPQLTLPSVGLGLRYFLK